MAAAGTAGMLTSATDLATGFRAAVTERLTGRLHPGDVTAILAQLGPDGPEIPPAGGCLHYGVVRNNYLMVPGSIPGPGKRLIRLRDPVRYTRGIQVQQPDIRFVSTGSKQGV